MKDTLCEVLAELSRVPLGKDTLFNTHATAKSCGKDLGTLLIVEDLLMTILQHQGLRIDGFCRARLNTVATLCAELGSNCSASTGGL